jgi:23S rRNA (cytosine1962-C5)-methyltransferase
MINIDYKLIDSGESRRLEKFGEFILDRPDPQVIWSKSLQESIWQKADAKYQKTFNDKGKWIVNTKVPEKWIVDIDGIKVFARLTPFKHTGIFPEQKFEWQLIKEKIKDCKNKPKILNLFGYTGVASLFAAREGALVTHVDASRPAISWFRENQKLSNLMEKPVRIIVDDVVKFVKREVKRGNVYDGIILDPPAYGHGPNGEKWQFNKDLPILLENLSKIISPNPLFIIINGYAITTSSITLANVLRSSFPNIKGGIKHGELILEEESEQRILSTGIYAILT